MAERFEDRQSVSSLSCVFRSINRRTRVFRKDCDGSTAIEFPFVILPFLMFFVASVELGQLYFASQKLQQAAESLGRPIRTSTPVDFTSTRELIRQSLCSNEGGPLRGFFDCDKIRVDIRSPSDWSGAEMSNDYDKMQREGDALSLPEPGRIAIVRVGYPLPDFLNFNFFPGSSTDGNGRPVRMIAGVAAFRVEPR